MTDRITGGCLCGAVRYTCTADGMVAGHCHCTDCQRAGGIGHSSHMMVPKAAVSIEGELRAFAKPADSGNIVERCFCPTCGTQVLSRNSGYPDALFLRAGALDDKERFQPTMVVYTDRAPSWDVLPASLHRFPLGATPTDG